MRYKRLPKALDYVPIVELVGFLFVFFAESFERLIWRTDRNRLQRAPVASYIPTPGRALWRHYVLGDNRSTDIP